MNYELYHYGTKGMKWGIRKYQNEDGSLTEAGQKRYNSGNEYRDAKHLAKDLNKLNKQYARATTESRYQKGVSLNQTKKAFNKGHLSVDNETGTIKTNIKSRLVKSSGKHALAGIKYQDIASKIESNQWKLLSQMANKEGAALISSPKSKRYTHEGNKIVGSMFGAVGGAASAAIGMRRSGVDAYATTVTSQNFKAVKKKVMIKNELYHYGVLGMKWGIRKAAKQGKTYDYKSFGQKRAEKKYAKNPSIKNEAKLATYKVRDERRVKYANSISVGKQIVNDLLKTPIGNGTYARLKASGMSNHNANVGRFKNTILQSKKIENASARAGAGYEKKRTQYRKL